jgi:hypothetical protein
MARLPDPSRTLTLLRCAEVQGGMVQVAEAARILGVPEARVADVAVRLAELDAPPFGPEDLFDIVVSGQWLCIDPPRGYTDFANLTPADVALFRACLRALEPGLDVRLRERCIALERRLEGLLGAALASETRHGGGAEFVEGQGAGSGQEKHGTSCRGAEPGGGTFGCWCADKLSGCGRVWPCSKRTPPISNVTTWAATRSSDPSIQRSVTHHRGIRRARPSQRHRALPKSEQGLRSAPRRRSQGRQG